jgi:hypothetical protein
MGLSESLWVVFYAILQCIGGKSNYRIINAFFFVFVLVTCTPMKIFLLS